MSTSKTSNERRTEVSEIDPRDNSRNYFNVLFVRNEVFLPDEHIHLALSNWWVLVNPLIGGDDEPEPVRGQITRKPWCPTFSNWRCCLSFFIFLKKTKPLSVWLLPEDVLLGTKDSRGLSWIGSNWITSSRGTVHCPFLVSTCRFGLVSWFSHVLFLPSIFPPFLWFSSSKDCCLCFTVISLTYLRGSRAWTLEMNYLGLYPSFFH